MPEAQSCDMIKIENRHQYEEAAQTILVIVKIVKRREAVDPEAAIEIFREEGARRCFGSLSADAVRALNENAIRL